ncbi:hypothetical protein HY477_00915 [Candidatus Uhrbacteria bacterium]|nr:hypothetical protein [Candidatus Uhrbacteria bacterium]
MDVTTEVYLDLDDTALDTAAFKQFLADSLVPHGVSTEAFFTAYRKVRAAGSFSIAKLVAGLPVELDKRELVAATLAQCAAECERFLYPDVLPFLETARQRRVRVVLYTYGDEGVQMLKLSGLQALTSQVDRVEITADSDKPLPPLAPKMRRIVIDDRLEVLKKYVGVAEVTPVLLARTNAARQPSKLTAYPTLIAVAQILTKEGLW